MLTQLQLHGKEATAEAGKQIARRFFATCLQGPQPEGYITLPMHSESLLFITRQTVYGSSAGHDSLLLWKYKLKL